MSIRLRRPGDADLTELLAECRGEGLTYAPTGGSLDGATPAGLRRHRWSVALPENAFDRAGDAIATWAVHRGAGLSVVADGPIEVGTNVAMTAPLPVGFVDVTCRLVAVVDADDRYGFAYGTLPVHPRGPLRSRQAGQTSRCGVAPDGWADQLRSRPGPRCGDDGPGLRHTRRCPRPRPGRPARSQPTLVAIFLALAFSIAICRGTRKGRRQRST